jgi:hypothetical protein
MKAVVKVLMDSGVQWLRELNLWDTSNREELVIQETKIKVPNTEGKKVDTTRYLVFVKKKGFGFKKKIEVIQATPAPLELDDELIDDECASHSSDQDSDEEDIKQKEFEAKLAEKHRLQDEEEKRLKAERRLAFANQSRDFPNLTALEREKVIDVYNRSTYGEDPKKRKKNDKRDNLLDRVPDPLGGI